MWKLTRLPLMAAILVSTAYPLAVSASGTPAHPRLVEQRPALRVSTARVSVMHYVAAPLHYQLRSVQATPIKMLPLRAQPTAVPVVKVFLPRFGLSELAAPLGGDECAARRSAILLSALPQMPFTPIQCEAQSTTRDSPTALVPGHNKEALYGPAYSRHDAEGP